MRAPATLAMAAAQAAAAAAAMPVVGTYLEPWYTARSAYHWKFPAADSCGAGASLLFADVDGDGRDDLLRAGCGGDGWVVALSNGVDGWENASVWWRDGATAAAQRFVADLDGDGAADAAVWTAGSWSIALSDRRTAFGKVQRVEMPCAAAAHRLVSQGSLWCVEAGGSGSSVWRRFDVRAQKHAAAQHLAAPATPFTPPMAQVWVADVTNDTKADAVAVDTGGNVFVGAGDSSGSLGTLQLGLRNFTAARGATCPPGPLLLSPSSATTSGFLQQRGGGSAMVVCVGGDTGYWYAAGIAPGRPASAAPAPIATWK